MNADGVHVGEHAGPSSHPSTSAAELKKEKRRIPKDLRQRSEVSCDRCKQRKIRCIRPDPPDQSGPCNACESAGLVCESTLPRKQRLYASVDQLSVRYRVMDAILRASHPGVDFDSLDGILGLATSVGVDVPQSEGEIVPLDPTKLELPTKGILPPELRPFLSSHAVPLSTDQMSGVFKIPEGSLVPAPRGGYHYVGPASLAVFAKHVRELVTKCNLSSMLTFDDHGVRRFLKAAEFTTSRTSQAIEARIEGHPATAAAEEDDVGGSVDGVQMSGQGLGQGGDMSGLVPPGGVYPGGTSGGFMSLPSPIASSPRSTLKYRRLLEVLPDKNLSDTLVRAFFDVVHPNFTIFHRGTFQMRYETLWMRNTRPGQAAAQQPADPEPGWVCALYMIYVLGAQALEAESNLAQRSASIQQKFLALVIRDGLSRLALTASLANVQALMLLSLYQHNAGERNAAWMLLGQAARTAVALGMHRDGEHGNFDPFERNTRRMVWWVLHIFEQNLSFALGRPSNTDLIDTTAVLPEETFVDGGDLPPGYFERAVALTEICSRVKRFTASIASDYEDPAQMATTTQTALHIASQLSAWRSDLPAHFTTGYQFATSRHRRAVLLLHILCDHLRSLLGRSYLMCRINHTLDSRSATLPPLPKGVGDMAQVSVDSAKAVVDNLLHLARHRSLEGSIWIDFYYVHHASFIFGLEFLAKPSGSGHSPREKQDRQAIMELLKLAQTTRLAPTYRILMNIALQLAYVVGIGPDDIDSEAEDVQSSGPLPVRGPNGLAGIPENLPGFDQVDHFSAFAAGNGAGVAAGSYPIVSAAPNPVVDSSMINNVDPFSNAAINTNNFQPSFTTLEHLFGPLPPSQHNSPPDLFADLYNFGLDTSAQNPWDFFNIGMTAEELMSGLHGSQRLPDGR